MNMKLLIALVVLACVFAIGLVAWIGPEKLGTWNRVVHTDVVTAIEGRLGEVRVRQGEMNHRLASLSAAMEKLREGQITTEVKAEMVGKRVQQTAALQVRAENALVRVREFVAANEPATVGGHTYSQIELNHMAERVMAALEAVRGQRSILEQGLRMFTDTAAKLRERYEQGRFALSQLQNQFALINGKVESLTILRDAASIAGASDGSLAGQFQRARSDLDSLFGVVDSQLRIEADRWQTDPLTGTPNIEPLLKELGGSEATLQRIDELLGTNGGKP